MTPEQDYEIAERRKFIAADFSHESVRQQFWSLVATLMPSEGGELPEWCRESINAALMQTVFNMRADVCEETVMMPNPLESMLTQANAMTEAIEKTSTDNVVVIEGLARAARSLAEGAAVLMTAMNRGTG